MNERTGMKMKKIFILLLILSIFFLIGAECSFASTLSAGDPFTFTITVNSDENLSFAEAQTLLTAVLCPLTDSGEKECQTLSMNVDGSDETVMRVVFSAEALPAAGDYTLDVNFIDATGIFADQSAAYLLKGVRPAKAELLIGSDITPTVTETPADTPVTETPTDAEITITPTDAELTEAPADAEVTETPEPVIDISMTVKPVNLVPEFLDENGAVLNYSTSLYVNEPYVFRLRSDSAMNDSVAVSVELPSSLRSAPLDPESECLQYRNEEGSSLVLPGSLWNEENGYAFGCEIRYNDRAWLTADPIVISVNASGIIAEETYEMAPMRWTNYPTNITQYPATHQAQIYDSRGNLLCSDTVHCGMFSSDEIYILTYKFPADWGANLSPDKDLSVDLTWPDAWAAALRQSENMSVSGVFGDTCTVDENGVTHLDLSEVSAGRYQASCAFIPGAIRDAVTSSIRVHFNDNAWAVQDLNLGLSPVIVREQPAEPTQTPEPVFTEVTETANILTEEAPAGTPTPEPVFDIPMTVKPVSLTPSITDENGNALIYGSTLYVGESYYFSLRSDTRSIPPVNVCST